LADCTGLNQKEKLRRSQKDDENLVEAVSMRKPFLLTHQKGSSDIWDQVAGDVTEARRKTDKDANDFSSRWARERFKTLLKRYVEYRQKGVGKTGVGGQFDGGPLYVHSFKKSLNEVICLIAEELCRRTWRRFISKWSIYARSKRKRYPERKKGAKTSWDLQ
jgi:hypothetical protein